MSGSHITLIFTIIAQNYHVYLNHHNLCHIILAGSPLEKLGEATYEELFVTALKNHGILSVGLYRLIIIIIITINIIII